MHILIAIGELTLEAINTDPRITDYMSIITWAVTILLGHKIMETIVTIVTTVIVDGVKAVEIMERVMDAIIAVQVILVNLVTMIAQGIALLDMPQYANVIPPQMIGANLIAHVHHMLAAKLMGVHVEKAANMEIVIVRMGAIVRILDTIQMETAIKI